MTIEVRLFATLRKHLPPGSGRSKASLEVQAGSSITDLLNELGIPVPQAFLVLVDGHYQGNRHLTLEPGNIVSIWPPIAGG